MIFLSGRNLESIREKSWAWEANMTTHWPSLREEKRMSKNWGIFWLRRAIGMTRIMKSQDFKSFIRKLLQRRHRLLVHSEDFIQTPTMKPLKQVWTFRCRTSILKVKGNHSCLRACHLWVSLGKVGGVTKTIKAM